MRKNHPLHINIPITKIDEEQRMVWGYATVEEVDAHGEIIGYQASKKAFPSWLGNIREMHGDKAIGKRIEVQFDDENKGVWLGSYISESADGENAWVKVKEGILQAYSIGGNINEFKMVKMDGSDHRMVTDYDLFEVSLVDAPACPSAMLQVVKSINGQLTEVEKMTKGLGRPVHWWETMHRYSPSQSIIKSHAIAYNKDSMTKQTTQLIKDIFTADALVDLGSCLADYIWFASYEGKDTTDLESALESIKSAAATELKGDENFPEPIMLGIELGLKTLNISKVEELSKMVEDKSKLHKAGAAAGDSDPRDDKAATVSETTPAAPIKPAAAKVPKNVYGADGKTTTAKGAAAGDGAAADESPAPTATPITVNKPGDKVDPPADPETPPADPENPEAPAAPEHPQQVETLNQPNGEGAAHTEEVVQASAAGGDIEKSTDSDLAKTILSGVGELIEKAVKPLEEEIERLKGQPAPSKRGTSYTDVEKVEKGNTEMDQNKARFDELMIKANDFAAHPEKGTLKDRMAVGIELRKLSRLMDPASRAQHAAIRASLNNSPQ